MNRCIFLSLPTIALVVLFHIPSPSLAQNIPTEARHSQKIERQFGTGQTQRTEAITMMEESSQLRGFVLLGSNNTRGSVMFIEMLEVSTNTPFQMCGITLRLANAAPENVRIFIRPRNQAESAWILLAIDDHADNESMNDDLARQTGNITLHTHPAILAAETRRVEVKVELVRSALRRNPVLQSYHCFIHSPGHTASDALSSALPSSRQQKNSASLQNSTFPRPAFTTRTNWGCPWGQTSGPNTLTPTTPTHLIVHHSFSPGNDVTDWAAAVRGIWSFHVNSNGWSDVGYNWLIDPNGVIYQGRAWVGENDNTQGAHFCGFNGQTMGVCMLGNFNDVSPSPAALSSLVRLLAYRTSANSLNPRGVSFHANSMRSLNHISGHRDGCATDCPGNALYPQLPALRNRVFALLNPPVIEKASVSVLGTQSAEVSALVRPNGSATTVFVEWDNALSVPPTLRNRRMVRQFTAEDTASTVSTVISGLDPRGMYVYRFIAQNSDTTAQTLQNTFSLGQTSVAVQQAASNLRITPNPVSDLAHITYTLDAPAFVRIHLRDIRGTIIATLVNGTESKGEHTTTFREENIANGLYYCYLEIMSAAQNHYTVQPLMVVR
jgi:N-acetylmuramoyl-L-alanine amidase